MKPIRSLLALATTGALLAAGIAAASALSTTAAAHCSSSEGNILAYVPHTKQSCPGLITLGLPIYQGETLQSGTTGQLTFQTNHLHRCIEFRDGKGSTDVVYPRNGIALRHLRGKTWCEHLPSDPFNTLTAVGAIIKTNGTIFGIDSSKRGTRIKVALGSVAVRSTATHKTVTVQAGYQTFTPSRGRPQKPSLMKQPQGQDQQAVVLLSTDTLSMGAPGTLQYLQQHKETSAVVVGQDTAAATTEADLLRSHGYSELTITADQVEANPKIVLVSAREEATHTIIAVGGFTAMRPAVQKIASLLHPPFALLTSFTP